MREVEHKVVVIGCGWMGEQYVEAYTAYPETEVVAIVESNPERRDAVGERFGVGARYSEIQVLLQEIVPDIAAIVTPTKYFKEVLTACVEAGVKAVSLEKPMAATLSDADEMVDMCASHGVLLAGGRVYRALNEVQEIARKVRTGEYGEIVGAAVHNWGAGSEVSGGGNQHVSVLRLLTGAEIEEVVAWGTPSDALVADTDLGLTINGQFRLTNGVECPVFGMATPYGGLDGGVDVWSDTALIRVDSDRIPELYMGFDNDGHRIQQDVQYEPYEWSEFGHLTGSIRSFLATIDSGSDLWVSGHDLRQALEVAIAAKVSAASGNVPIRLPLQDRSLTLYPNKQRWLGQDTLDA